MNNISIFEQNIRTAIFKLAIPSILGMLFISSQVIIDGIFISNFIGPKGLAGINLSMPFINLIFAIVMMIGIGGSVLSAKFKGEKNYAKSNEIFSFTVYIYAISIILISFLSYIFKHELIMFLGSNDAVFSYVDDYLKIMIISSLFFNLPLLLEPFLRVDEKSYAILISGFSALFINVSMNYLFIAKLGLGLKGAALGSSIANLISGLVLIFFLIIKGKNFKIKKIKFDNEIFKNIICNGSSEFFTIISASITIYIFNIILMKRIGELAISALTIVFYSNIYIDIILIGLSQALQPIIAYNLGAKKIDNIKKTLFIGLSIGALIGVSAFLLINNFSYHLVSLFSKNNKLLENLTLEIISLFVFTYFFSFANIIISGFHTAIEKPFESSIIAIFRSVGLVVPLLFILPLFLGDKGLWIATPTAEFFTILISITLLKKSSKSLHLKIQNKNTPI